jgi:hypothetical protein
MSKYIPALIISLFLSSIAFSQAQLGTVEYRKKDRQAIVIYSQYPPDIVVDAIIQRMEQAGNKGKEDKAFLSKSSVLEFKNASIPEFNIRGVDMVFKVEPRNKREKDESVVYLILMRGVDDYVTTASDPELIESSKNFLSSHKPRIEAQNLEMEIGKQDEIVKKEEKKLESMMQEQLDLEKKLKSLQDKLLLNKKDQETQMAAITNQKTILENMKGKRKS